MNLKTYFKFLIGDKEAIICAAKDKNTLLYGALLVLSAGLAREYDWHYLPIEPYHLLKPFAGSFLIAFLLFNLVKLSIGFRYKFPLGYWKSFLIFLGVFWLTAPFAWVYSIPYERFFDPYTTAQFNLWSLLFVSVVRVTLMIKIVSVLTNTKIKNSAPLVLVLCSAIATVGLFFVNIDLVGFMSGMRSYTDAETLILSIIRPLMVITFYGTPVFFVLSYWFNRYEKNKCFIITELNSTKKDNKILTLAISVCVFFILILPFTQKELYHTYKITNDLNDGNISSATEYMNKLKPKDLPPHWMPYGDHKWIPHWDRLLIELKVDQNKDWVNRLFAKKILFYAKDANRFHKGADPKLIKSLEAFSPVKN